MTRRFCTATSKRTHKRCGGTAIPGTTVCHWHGGRSPRGVAAPAFRHGRYVKDLPVALALRYQAARQDPELVSLEAEVALVDSRIGDLIARLREGLEHGPAWSAVKGAWAKVVEARAGGPAKAADLVKALSEVGTLIEQGVSEDTVWADLTHCLYLRKTLVDSESKHRKDLQQVVTLEQLQSLIAALTESVRRHVVNRGMLADIQADFSRLLALPEKTE